MRLHRNAAGGWTLRVGRASLGHWRSPLRSRSLRGWWVGRAADPAERDYHVVSAWARGQQVRLAWPPRAGRNVLWGARRGDRLLVRRTDLQLANAGGIRKGEQVHTFDGQRAAWWLWVPAR